MAWAVPQLASWLKRCDDTAGRRIIPSTVNPLLERLFGSSPHAGRMLGGFVDSLLQSFENCRVGLSDETLRGGEKAVQPFFLELYEKEVGRLRETILLLETGLSTTAKRELFEKVDELVRKVVLPAYARLAVSFTQGERNDFYLAPEPFHGLERFGWGAAGMALGGFAILAPFIPLWEKEWILPFVVVGLLFPNIRRYFKLRRYQSELDRLVTRADDEIWRMDLAYLTSLTSGEGAGEASAEPAAREASSGSSLDERLTSTGGAARDDRPRPKLKQGGR
jgi:hypothetical protein